MKKGTIFLVIGIALFLLVALAVYTNTKRTTPTPTPPVAESAFPTIETTRPTSTSTLPTKTPTENREELAGKPLTYEQRESVTARSDIVGDEAAYVMASTTIYHIWYSGINDAFGIVLRDPLPTIAHRREAEREIATALDIPEEDVCTYRITVAIEASPFVLPDTVTRNCP